MTDEKREAQASNPKLFSVLSDHHNSQINTIRKRTSIFQTQYNTIMKLILTILALATLVEGFAPHIGHNFSSSRIAVLQRANPHQDLYDAEEAAAVDAHDVSDPGMEGAAMERSAMLAEELMHAKKVEKKVDHKNRAPRRSDGKMGRLHVHKSTVAHQDIYEAEESAAFDAHDVSDAGMEAAAMERAVMMAADIMKKKKKH